MWAASLSAAGWATVAAMAGGLVRMWREESHPHRVIGLLYHRIVPRALYDTFSGTEQIFSMPEDRFSQQLGWLRDNGYHFVTLDQLEAHLKERTPLPERSVCITFDDGCESVYKHALPILQRHAVPAAVFVTVDDNAWIFHEGEYYERRLSVEEIRALDAAGVTIGSHAISHRGLNEMSPEDVRRELMVSRETLSEWIGKQVRHFAVPLNFYNRATLHLCQEVGYGSVSTSDNGTSNPGTDPYRIKRFIVEGSYDLVAFERSLTPRVILQKRVLNTLKKIPPKVLGERLWMPLRERLFASPLGRWLTFGHLRRALFAIGVLGFAALLALTWYAFA